MANEYRLPYTASEVDEKLRKVDLNEANISQLSSEIVNLGGCGLVEPMEDDIPKVFIDGVIPTTKDDVLAEMTYISKTDEFHAYLKIKCQGNSSMSYDKKNFTIKMYSDEARETKLKKAFKDWGVEQNKYVLKANFIDHSHARNIVSARLWGEVVASRSDYELLPTELKTSPNNGAIDGFPIKLYANGTYNGIYTWNIGKDDWLWNMNEDNPNHILMCAETNTNETYAETPCNFRALWSGVNEQDWSVEVGSNSDELKNSLNNLITCVKDTNDETFMATIGNYLDLQSAIDYYIHQYVICGLDGLAKNMLIGTYDLQKWIMGAYDMDGTFGLWWDGTKYARADLACPEEYQEKFNLLWERLEKLYSERIKERYIELRKTVYSYSNIITNFEKITNIIGKDIYAKDLEVYPEIPSSDTNNIEQIRSFVRERLTYCDTEFKKEIVSILPEQNILHNIEWYDGYLEYGTGNVIPSTIDKCSDFIDVTSYSGKVIYTNAIGITDSYAYYYNANNEYWNVSALNNISIEPWASSTKSIRLSFNTRRINRIGYDIYLFVANENLFRTDNIQEGSYNSKTGEYEPDTTGKCNIAISVTEGENYLVHGITEGFFFDAYGNIVSKISGELISFRTVSVPKSAIRFVAVAEDTSVTNKTVCITKNYTVIGHAKVTLDI